MKRRPYTLIELLAVIAIMALLMLIALPNLPKIARGAGADVAAVNIYNYLSLCRDYAITNRQYVAVVMPQADVNGTPSPAGKKIPDTCYNAAYRACIVNNLSGSTADFVRWVPNETWQYLPTGSLILELDDSNSDAPIPNPSNGTTTTINNVDFDDVRPHGTTASSYQDVDTIPAILFKPTGRAGGQRYVEIGEGQYQGGSLTITNRDPAAYITVTVDQYTGRVSYGEN